MWEYPYGKPYECVLATAANPNGRNVMGPSASDLPTLRSWLLDVCERSEEVEASCGADPPHAQSQKRSTRRTYSAIRLFNLAWQPGS